GGEDGQPLDFGQALILLLGAGEPLAQQHPADALPGAARAALRRQRLLGSLKRIATGRTEVPPPGIAYTHVVAGAPPAMDDLAAFQPGASLTRRGLAIVAGGSIGCPVR